MKLTSEKEYMHGNKCKMEQIEGRSHRVVKLANKMSIYFLCESFGNFVVVINVGNFLKRHRHDHSAQGPQQPLQAASFKMRQRVGKLRKIKRKNI